MSAKHTALLNRALRAFPGRQVGPIVEAARSRAIIGPANIPVSEVAAQRALDQLQAGQIPAPADLAALEVLIRVMRPAPLSRAGELDPLEVGGTEHLFPEELLREWEEFRSAIKPYLYSIGRIDTKNKGVGTGFLIAPDLLVTNRHVVSLLSNGTDELDAGVATVAFHQEYGRSDPPDATVAIDRVVAVHPQLDMALLGVGGSGRQPLPALVRDVVAGERVVVVGYPQKDTARNPIFAESVYNGRYGVKRAALGEVIDVAGLQFWHDCSTLGGNSGSPVLSLTDRKVVGIHFSGFFMYRNQAVASSSLMEFVEEYR